MRKRPREPKPVNPALASASGPTLIKHLASCNTSVRSQSLRLLQSWLASQSHELSDSDIKKLWKGLFYCLWHADKSPNQVALIDKLTSMFQSLQSSLALEFFRGFLVTLRREWPGIDRLRLDKFYLLIRRSVKALFELMRLRKWDSTVLAEYFGVLERDGFLAEDKLQGNGVCYHVVSVFLEELKGVGFPVKKEVVDVIFKPFFAVLLRSKDRVLLGKVKGSLFDELVKLGREMLEKKRMGVVCEEKDGDVMLGLVALRMGLSGRFYEVGSSAECVQGNRKVALGLHEDFLKLEKELESSGVEIVIPKYNYDVSDDEVPQLIPIDYSTSNGSMELDSQEGAEDTLDDEGQADGRSRKKRKKAKKGIGGDDKKDKRSNGNVELDSQEGAEDTLDDGGQADVKSLKKSKKAKKGIDGDDKKDKKKKKKKKLRKDNNEDSEINAGVEENGDIVTAGIVENRLSPDLKNDLENGGSAMDLDENVISNLQIQFERVAAEAGSYVDDDSDSSDAPLISVKHGKHANKKKRTKGAGKKESDILNSNGAGEGVDAGAKSVDKSAKKVRFSMKNNLVWKPQTPLPPESLRIPPSVTPRGSALKKGVPPGPVIEIPPVKKKLKQKKKAQRRLKNVIPAMKRRKKILVQSV